MSSSSPCYTDVRAGVDGNAMHFPPLIGNLVASLELGAFAMKSSCFLKHLICVAQLERPSL